MHGTVANMDRELEAGDDHADEKSVALDSTKISIHSIRRYMEVHLTRSHVQGAQDRPDANDNRRVVAGSCTSGERTMSPSSMEVPISIL